MFVCKKIFIIAVLCISTVYPTVIHAQGNNAVEMLNCSCSCPLSSSDLPNSGDKTPEPVSDPEPTPEPEPTPPPKIRINELLPDPEGLDSEGEFIELINLEDSTTSVSSWSLRVKSRTYQLPPLTLIAGGIKFWLITESKLTLSNSGSTVELLDQTGQVVDQVSYEGTAPTGQSFARKHDNSWQWTELISPGQANLFPTDTETPEPIAAEESEEETEESPSSPENPPNVEENKTETDEQPKSVAEITPICLLPDLTDDAEITIQGQITLKLGYLGKTMFMVQNGDGECGTVVRITTQERPDLIPGQFVTISGKITRLSTGWRVSAKGRDIEIGEIPTSFGAKSLELDKIKESMAGTYLQLTGLIASRTGTRLRITDESGNTEITILLEEDTELPGQVGDTAVAIGALNWNKGQPELIVTRRADLIIKPPIEEVASTDSENPEVASEDQSGLAAVGAIAKNIRLDGPASGNRKTGPSPWPLVLAGAAVASALAWVWLNNRRRQSQSLNQG